MVQTEKDWWAERRPEIVEDFDREVYGRVPQKIPGVRWEVVGTVHDTNGDAPVLMKKLVGHMDNSSYPLVNVDIQLTLTIPANATAAVPVIMELRLSPEVMAELAKRFPDAHPDPQRFGCRRP
jgi:(4-O-methyl)-D-glucuronate---lignin esterase